MNIQDWFPLGVTGLISLQSKRLSRVFPTPQFKSINSLVLSFLHGPTLISIESVMPFNHLILGRPLLPPPSIFLSIRVFSNKSALRLRWPNYWSLSFSISPSDDYSGLISFRIDWFDLLAVQRTLKSLLQNHNLKALIFLAIPNSFFKVVLSFVMLTLRMWKWSFFP